MSLHGRSVTRRSANTVQSPAAEGDHEGLFSLINLIEGRNSF